MAQRWQLDMGLRLGSTPKRHFDCRAQLSSSLDGSLLFREHFLSFKTYPNFGLSGPPIEIAFGPIAIGLTVVAFQPMLLGGLVG